MRIKNKNVVVFVLVCLFIVAGFGMSFIKGMYASARQLVIDIQNGNADVFLNFTTSVDERSSSNISYHGVIMNVYSAKERLMNKKVVKKGEEEIIAANDGTLVEIRPMISDKAFQESTVHIKQLYEASVANGAGFLYIAAPKKGHGFSLPENTNDYTVDNYQRYIASLTASEIPTLDLAKELQAQGLLTPDAFYTTDHHWKAEIGFWATNEICKEIDRRYSFPYEQEYLDISNYQVTNYEDWFLGSYGKKAGAYFLPTGADDFSLIVPKFKTNLTEEQPFKNQIRTGPFEETALYMENISKKDWYKSNPYATYGGGDFRLQILENHLAPNDKKVLIIRDSFAGVVTPFLALQAKELHVIDVRNYSYYIGEKINVYDYIKEINPDYVLVLYAGDTTKNSDGRLDFD